MKKVFWENLKNNNLLWGIVSGLSLHLIIFGFLYSKKSIEHHQQADKRPSRVRLVKSKPKPKPILVSEKQVETLKKDTGKIQKKIKKKEKKKNSIKKQKPIEKEETQPQKKPVKKVIKPKKFAISMEAVVESGTVIVQTAEAGETAAFGSLEGDPNAKSQRVIYDASDPTVISSLPVLKEQASQLERQKEYPKKAKREGIEANVSLSLLIDEIGLVRNVKVIEKAGNGFDQAAMKLAKKFIFEPALKNGIPVSVLIPWTYKFRLD